MENKLLYIEFEKEFKKLPRYPQSNDIVTLFFCPYCNKNVFKYGSNLEYHLKYKACVENK